MTLAWFANFPRGHQVLSVLARAAQWEVALKTLGEKQQRQAFFGMACFFSAFFQSEHFKQLFFFWGGGRFEFENPLFVDIFCVYGEDSNFIGEFQNPQSRRQ